MSQPWNKQHDMARKCSYCGSQKPGMQPLTLYHKHGTKQRGYWHLKCFEKARKALEKANDNLPK